MMIMTTKAAMTAKTIYDYDDYDDGDDGDYVDDDSPLVGGSWSWCVVCRRVSGSRRIRDA